ncbi:MAG: hypothetical protein J2P25_04120 [Nocardiopsaceae bacterium]|nr:hypothetical protein [Nocardiopsaceae bacterium]
MASVLSQPTPQSPTPPTRGLPWPGGKSPGRVARISAFTATAVALSLPLIALAVWANSKGFVAPTMQYVHARAATAARGPGLSHLQYVYPPLPVLLSLILPGGPLALSIVTCLFSGTMLAYMLWQAPSPWALALLAPLVAVPAMWFIGSQLLPQVVAISFLAVALQGFIRFSAYGETYGGFIAGLALAVSYSADPAALLYAGVMCVFVFLTGAARYRGHIEAPVGVCAVLVFPCVAMAACWSFLLWKFTGNWPGNLDYSPNAHVLAFPQGVLPGLGNALVAAAADLVRAMLYPMAAALVAIRRRTRLFGVGLVLPVLALAVARWLGFDYSPVNAYFTLTVLAVTVIIENRLLGSGRYRWIYRWILIAAVIAQVVIAVAVWPPTSIGFDAWRHELFG